MLGAGCSPVRVEGLRVGPVGGVGAVEHVRAVEQPPAAPQQEAARELHVPLPHRARQHRHLRPARPRGDIGTALGIARRLDGAVSKLRAVSTLRAVWTLRATPPAGPPGQRLTSQLLSILRLRAVPSSHHHRHRQ